MTCERNEDEARGRLLREFYDAFKDRGVTLVCSVSGTIKNHADDYAVRLVPVEQVARTSRRRAWLQDESRPG